MKPIQHYSLFVLIGLSIAGCYSSEPTRSTAEEKKQFAGGPMPPDAQKKFQESMKRSHDLMQKSPAGGKQ